jgi:hypothetical protein
VKKFKEPQFNIQLLNKRINTLPGSYKLSGRFYRCSLYKTTTLPPPINNPKSDFRCIEIASRLIDEKAWFIGRDLNTGWDEYPHWKCTAGLICQHP